MNRNKKKPQREEIAGGIDKKGKEEETEATEATGQRDKIMMRMEALEGDKIVKEHTTIEEEETSAEDIEEIAKTGEIEKTEEIEVTEEAGETGGIEEVTEEGVGSVTGTTIETEDSEGIEKEDSEGIETEEGEETDTKGTEIEMKKMPTKTKIRKHKPQNRQR